MSMVNNFDEHNVAEADEKIAVLLSEPNGLEKIASDVLPDLIKEQRDYIGFARKVLVVDPVGRDQIVKQTDGGFYRQYPKDVGAAAAFYGEEAEAGSYKLEGSIVNVAILTIMSDEATIDKKRLLVERIDYLDRAKKKAAQIIAKLEDYKVLQLAELSIAGTSTDKAAPDNENQVVTTVDTILAKSHLVALKKIHSRADLVTSIFLMNPATLDDILAWDDSDLDDTTRRELLESGVRYTLWKVVSLVTSRIIPDTLVYTFAEKEYTGVIPVLLDLTSEITETKVRLIKGLFLYEFIGFAIFNTKAVGKLILGFEDGDDLINSYTEPEEGIREEIK